MRSLLVPPVSRRFGAAPVSVMATGGPFAAGVALLLVALWVAGTVPEPVAGEAPRLLAPAPRRGVRLAVVGWRVMHETSFVKVSGRIRNHSRAPIHTIRARASFLDRQSAILAETEAVVLPPLLLPDETGRFELAIPDTLMPSTIAITFDAFDGVAIPYFVEENAHRRPVD